MRYQTYINLGLLLLILILCLIMFNDKEIIKHAQTTKISSIDPATINSISIMRQDGKNIQFNKLGETWNMIKPYQAPAHPNRIEAILKLLSTESSNQLKTTELDLQSLGLATPGVTLKLNDDIFEFGATTAIDNLRYVKHDDVVHTINDHLYHQLNTNERFFIDTKVIANSDNIVSITANNYRVFKSNDTWKMELTNDLIETTPNIILNGWQQLQASSVKPIENNTVLEKVIFLFTDESTLTLDVAATDPNVILINRELNLQYQINDFMKDIIFPKAKAEE